MASVIEQCQVGPPPGSAAELTLPLTYFDYPWLSFHRIRLILFYKLPVSKPDFVQTIIPNLKDSLSLTLKHYIPLAGHVVCPLTSSGYPELCYVTGDSISVILSEIDKDFNCLVGNDFQNVKDFYPLVPQMTGPRHGSGVQLAPVLAIQVTLFPNHGISIGFTYYHVVGDGSTIVGFVRAWALLNKFNRDEQHLTNEFTPFYDRSVIKDPYGQAMSIWDEMKKNKLDMRDVVTPSNKVRGTFIITQDDIGKFKNLVLSRRPNLTYVTSFTVTCAYIWTCLIKSEAAIGEDIDENGMEFFVFAADWRGQFNPPLPPAYFGNCVLAYIARTKHVDLAGTEGFIIAAESIGETIKKNMKAEESILNGEFSKELNTVNWNRIVSVTGSPKLDFYAVDFGWGRPKMLEFVSIDSDNGVTMSLSKSNGDLEIGLCLPRTRMNSFAALFTHGLSFL